MGDFLSLPRSDPPAGSLSLRPRSFPPPPFLSLPFPRVSPCVFPSVCVCVCVFMCVSSFLCSLLLFDPPVWVPVWSVSSGSCLVQGVPSTFCAPEIACQTRDELSTLERENENPLSTSIGEPLSKIL